MTRALNAEPACLRCAAKRLPSPGPDDGPALDQVLLPDLRQPDQGHDLHVVVRVRSKTSVGAVTSWLRTRTGPKCIRAGSK